VQVKNPVIDLDILENYGKAGYGKKTRDKEEEIEQFANSTSIENSTTSSNSDTQQDSNSQTEPKPKRIAIERVKVNLNMLNKRDQSLIADRLLQKAGEKKGAVEKCRASTPEKRTTATNKTVNEVEAHQSGLNNDEEHMEDNNSDGQANSQNELNSDGNRQKRSTYSEALKEPVRQRISSVEHVPDRSSYKVTIHVTDIAARKFSDKYLLAEEIEKFKLSEEEPYDAHIRESKVLITCYSKPALEKLVSIWPNRAFDGILRIETEFDAASKEELILFGIFKRKPDNQDKIMLKRKYTIYEIKHINYNTYKIWIQDKQMYNLISNKGSCQMGTERILLSVPRERNNDPRPTQCHICQEYGHTKNHCPTIDLSNPQGTPVCRYCAKNHESRSCTLKNTAVKHRCANCEKNNTHKAGSSECPKYKEETMKAIVRSRNKDEQKEISMKSVKAASLVNENQLKTAIEEAVELLATYTKCIYYDKSIKYDKLSTVEKDLFNKTLKMRRNIRAPLQEVDVEEVLTALASNV
jgi:hypothetical protein